MIYESDGLTVTENYKALANQDSSPAPPILWSQNVTVRFGGIEALRSVNFAAQQGTITGLVGPNGAGKTTLFGVLSGLLRAQEGTVYFLDRDVTRYGPERRSRLGLARTFQRVQLFEEMSVRDHLVLAFRVQHRPQNLLQEVLGLKGSLGDIEERHWIDQLLQMLHLDDVADALATSLPLGTARIVEVGRALASKPKVVLLDEPSSGLDATETQHLAAALIRIRDDSEITFVLVEHNVDLVFDLCNYLYVLDFGSIIAEGLPEEVRSDARVQAAYIGDPRP